MTGSTTQNRIIEAAIELVNEKGYKGATTKMIAEKANVNEVTLFRHFGSKKGIVEAAIHKYSFDELANILSDFEKNLTWNLHDDVRHLARQYQGFIEKRREIILISLKESGQFPELDQMISHVPLAYKQKLISYFSEMMDRGKIRTVDADATAANFMFLNFGYFMLKNRLHHDENGISLDAFIEKNLEPMIQSLVIEEA